jgi:hypothetical protein
MLFLKYLSLIVQIWWLFFDDVYDSVMTLFMPDAFPIPAIIALNKVDLINTFPYSALRLRHLSRHFAMTGI